MEPPVLIMLKSSTVRAGQLTLAVLLLLVSSAGADELHHLRKGEREWDTFPVKAEAESLQLSFKSSEAAPAKSLSFRQQNVKQSWRLIINGKPLGQLVKNENDMVVFMDVPVGVLKSGDNELTLVQTGRDVPDDIRFGNLQFFKQSVAEYLGQCSAVVRVIDKTTKQLTPCRLTILDENGSLFSTGNKSDQTTAVRAGVILSSTGEVTVKLPPGKFEIIAGRGFEWGIDSKKIEVTAGAQTKIGLAIDRQVDTAGLVSCDTHVHTFTYSRHGDASLDERLITIPAEGIELPIATDHNLHVNYEKRARELGVRKYFTPVIGNEVTTKIGHFNIFPVADRAPLPDHTLMTWEEIIQSIKQKTGAKAIILNHARDLHSNVRPFGPARHNSVTGKSQLDWPFTANAMELINSGATQTDVMQLYHDWFGLLNRGIAVTGVGCSDSHDVGRHFVGQGRTYIHCEDSDPGKIDVAEAVSAFVAGKANVSYGLLTTIEVNGTTGPGELAAHAKKCTAHITVQGPSWVRANLVELYANGQLVATATIRDGLKPGVKWQGNLELKNAVHDVHLVAVARGDGVTSLHWPTARPYQPDSAHFEPYTIGSTGVVRVDLDGDGTFTSALGYAVTLVRQYPKTTDLFEALARYDAPVASHVFAILKDKGVNLDSVEFQDAIKRADPQTQKGFRDYRRAELASIRARLE
jgi:hypothetical protein